MWQNSAPLAYSEVNRELPELKAGATHMLSYRLLLILCGSGVDPARIAADAGLGGVAGGTHFLDTDTFGDRLHPEDRGRCPLPTGEGLVPQAGVHSFAVLQLQMSLVVMLPQLWKSAQLSGLGSGCCKLLPDSLWWCEWGPEFSCPVCNCKLPAGSLPFMIGPAPSSGGRCGGSIAPYLPGAQISISPSVT